MYVCIAVTGLFLWYICATTVSPNYTLHSLDHTLYCKQSHDYTQYWTTKSRVIHTFMP